MTDPELTWHELEDIRAQKMIEGLGRAFPPEAIEQKRGFSYVSHDTVTRRLIEVTGGKFDWEVREISYRSDDVVKPQLINKDQPNEELIPVTVMIVRGDLTIAGLGTRSGIGVQSLMRGAGEDTYKGAESDAIKRAAMRFGVALALYGEDLEHPKPNLTALLTELTPEVKRLGKEIVTQASAKLFNITDSKKLTAEQVQELLQWTQNQADIAAAKSSLSTLPGATSAAAS